MLATATWLPQAGLYPEAAKAAARITGEAQLQRAAMLLVAIAYEQDDLQSGWAQGAARGSRCVV